MSLGVYDEGAVEALVERAVATVPFYAQHLARSRGRRLADLPTCTKADLSAWGARPLEATGVPVARWSATSGTTGRRLVVGFSPGDWERLGELLGRRGRMVGLGPGDVLANTHGYGLWIGGPALELMAMRAGATVLPVGPGSPENLATWLTELPVTALSATPSFLRVLAERDDPAPHLRIGLIGGEGATVELRRQVSAVLGDHFRWQELYGSTEVGGPTLGWAPPEDPLGGRLLVDTAEFVVEVLHPDHDEPAAAGELGEVTVTTPWRESSPLVRYRTRDLAAVVDDQSGRPSITTIAGRRDDALKVRGALVYPAVIEGVVVAHCAPGAEWRIVLDREPGRFDTVTLVVEDDRAGADGLADLVGDRIGVRVTVTVVAPGSLDRFHGKSTRVEDRRTP